MHRGTLPGRWLKLCLLVTMAFFFATYAGPAEAATEPGFLVGFADGLLSLLKLIASPFADFTLLDREAQSWFYDAGYCFGVLTFAIAAGSVASSGEVELRKTPWE